MTTEAAPTQQTGETNANFQARLLDYAYRTGGRTDGPNPAMAKTFTSQINARPDGSKAPNGFEVL